MSLLLLLTTLSRAETLYATAQADGVRWPDSAAVTLRLTAGDEVEVLLRDGERVRVRKGNDFGWVTASALSAERPALPDALPEMPAPPEAP